MHFFVVELKKKKFLIWYTIYNYSSPRPSQSFSVWFVHLEGNRRVFISLTLFVLFFFSPYSSLGIFLEMIVLSLSLSHELSAEKNENVSWRRHLELPFSRIVFFFFRFFPCRHRVYNEYNKILFATSTTTTTMLLDFYGCRCKRSKG